MKRLLLLVCLICGLCSIVNASLASSQDVDSKLYVCRDPELGIKFNCHPDWSVHFDERADLFVIAEDPEVVLTVVRDKSPMISLEQLTPDKIRELGHYADGFAMERARIAGKDAVRVKAFDNTYPDIRLTDIYFFHDGYLYRILFSVSPKESWPEYQFVLHDVIKSFQFMDQ